MDIDSHDYIIIAIIGVIIILQVWVFVVNILKIGDYKKTIRQAKNFEIIDVEVPEEWIKEIELKEILGNPEAFRELSANFNIPGSDNVSVNNENSSIDVIEHTVNEDSIYKNGSTPASPIKNDSIPEELDFPEEEYEPEPEVEEYIEEFEPEPEPEPEIEEYDEDDFEFEEEEYKVNGKSKR